MTKKNNLSKKSILIITLLVIPFFIMWLMGFGKYDANEFTILSVVLLADVVIFITYKLLFRQRNRLENILNASY